MIPRVLVKSVFYLSFILSCNFRNNNEIVYQVFKSDTIKTYIVHKVSGNNELVIFQNGKFTYRNEMGMTPCEVSKILNDTIFIERYFLVSSKIVRKGQGNNREPVRKIDNNLKLVINNTYLDGSINLGTKKVDSIKREGKNLRFYFKNNVVDSVDSNKLFYDGNSFSKTTVEGTNRVAIFFDILVKDFVNNYIYLEIK